MKIVETNEWLGMLSRMIRAAGKRVADADEHELARLVGMRDELEIAIRVAIDGQRQIGRSWDHVGRALGISRQGAFKRYSQSTGHLDPLPCPSIAKADSLNDEKTKWI
ncbi:MAG: hypothetical protein AB7U29_03570 [Desulfobulbus sp.]